MSIMFIVCSSDTREPCTTPCTVPRDLVFPENHSPEATEEFGLLRPCNIILVVEASRGTNRQALSGVMFLNSKGIS